ncbi:MAG: hypothetical protein KAR83_08325 [Thermodesulfovibrionales bacterium]|nr:hypothetical protein [Thermodesulfovibrionales bacterium]
MKYFGRILFILVAIVAGIYYYNDIQNERAIEKTKEEKRIEYENEINLKINQMVQKYNANDNWTEDLTSNKDFLAPVMTIEIERVWLNNPILFIGNIDDISTYNQSDYLLSISYSSFDSLSKYPALYSLDIELELKCPKKLVDTKIPNSGIIKSFLESNTAIIAQVDSVKNIKYFDDEGNQTNIRVGVGKCLDFIYVDNTNN